MVINKVAKEYTVEMKNGNIFTLGLDGSVKDIKTLAHVASAPIVQGLSHAVDFSHIAEPKRNADVAAIVPAPFVMTA